MTRTRIFAFIRVAVCVLFVVTFSVAPGQTFNFVGSEDGGQITGTFTLASGALTGFSFTTPLAQWSPSNSVFTVLNEPNGFNISIISLTPSSSPSTIPPNYLSLDFAGTSSTFQGGNTIPSVTYAANSYLLSQENSQGTFYPITGSASPTTCDTSAFQSQPLVIYFAYSQSSSAPDISNSSEAQGSITLAPAGGVTANGLIAWLYQPNEPAAGTGSYSYTETFSQSPPIPPITITGQGSLNFSSSAGLSIFSTPYIEGSPYVIGSDLTIPACSFNWGIQATVPTTSSNGPPGNYPVFAESPACTPYGGLIGPIMLNAGQISGTVTCPSEITGYVPLTLGGTQTLSWSTSPLLGPPPSGSVQITSAKISQGQPLDDGTAGEWFGETSVPVVLNRQAVVQVRGTTSGSVPSTLTVNLTLGNQTTSQQIGVSNLMGANGAFVNFTPSVAGGASLGENNLTVTVEPIQGVTITNAAPIPTAEFISSHPIEYVFTNVNIPGYTGVSDFSQMENLSNLFLQGVFPLDNSYTPQTASYEASTLPLCNGGALFNPAVTVLCNLSFLALVENADRAVGIVNSKYLPTVLNDPGTEGYSAGILTAGLVGDGWPETAAHELGHTYDLYDNGELYNMPGGCLTGNDAVASSAYWVQANELLPSGAGSLSNYMCANAAVPDDFYDSGGTTPDAWGTTRDWATVLQNFPHAQSDPEVLIIGGFVQTNGTVTLGASYRNPSGFAQISNGGDYAIRLLDGAGNILSSTAFTPDFHSRGHSTVDLTYAPFVFGLAYPSNAISVQVVNGTSVLASQNIAYGLLQTAIQMLSNSDTAPNALFYTQASLLTLVDELTQRLAVAQPSSGTACDGIYNGTFNGNITVSSGQTCTFVGGGITGNVRMTGGSLVLSNVSVGGNVQINGGGMFAIGPSTIIRGDLQIQNIPAGSDLNVVCGADVKGNLQFQNNAASVEIGSYPSCPGNTIGGDLQVQNNTAATQIYNNTVSGNLQNLNSTAATVIDGNTVGGNLQAGNNTVSTQVFNNSVTNNLQCQNDTSITGGGNTAKQKQGQCSSF